MIDRATPARSQLVDGLVELSFAVQSVIAAVAAAHDLSVPQLRLLGVLRDRRPAMVELANYFGVDKSSMTGLVDRAERRGLVRRQEAEHDRRGVHVLITALAADLVKEIEAAVQDRISELVEPLSAADQAAFEVLLEQLARGNSPTG